jgi:hypothetical protein
MTAASGCNEHASIGYAERYEQNSTVLTINAIVTVLRRCEG